MEDFYTTRTDGNISIFGAMHISSLERDDRCVSIAVGQCSTQFNSDVARSLAVWLLSASDVLDSIRVPVARVQPGWEPSSYPESVKVPITSHQGVQHDGT